MAFEFISEVSAAMFQHRNVVIYELMDDISSVAPARVCYKCPGLGKSKKGIPPKGMWCYDKFGSHEGWHVIHREVVVILNILEKKEAKLFKLYLDDHDSKELEEYKEFVFYPFKQFLEICIEEHKGFLVT